MMSNDADGWNFIETCFILWKCKNCNYHFAVEEANICRDINVKCPVCSWEVGYNEQTEEFNVVINYYGG